MNISAGFIAPDTGDILVRGRHVRFRTPKDALVAGIGMVHQHFRLVEQFTVAENLAIGASDIQNLTSSAALNQRATELEQRFGLSLDPTRIVAELSVGEKQRVEIVRTLARGARVLILDEPTAVLTPQESERLSETLRAMASAGTTIVLISHKLNEVLAVADRISVLRQGQLEATLMRQECDVSGLARLMVGRDLPERPRVHQVESTGGEVLRVEDVEATDERGLQCLKKVNFSVSEREIVAIAGVAGNGQRELEEIVTGLRDADAGSVSVGGARRRGVREFIGAGLAHIPEDRKGMGLVPSQPIWRNAILKNYRRAPISRGPVMRQSEARRFAAGLAAQVNLSTENVGTPVQHLSGGNAQKLLAGRELDGDRRVVVAVNPTQGLDIGAAAAVRSALLGARDRGMGVLLISADLDEVLEIADRILVLYGGEIVGECRAVDAERDDLGLLMGGSTGMAA
jgi:simple sugar transport system ATP-binding protein